MPRLLSWILVVTLGVLAAPAAVTPAAAKGGPVGGWGSQYFLNDAFTGTANHVFGYGDPGDEVYFGDWDGDGVDTPMVRRGAVFHVRNTNTTGVADVVFAYGNPGDEVMAGDWDGDGVDTLAVRRGNVYYLRNSVTTGIADIVFSYGNPGDVVLVGDWDGNGTDTFAVRRLATYFVRNVLTSGVADYTFGYGNPSDMVLVGDWDGNASDTLAVRRGNVYYLRNSTTTGVADVVFAYGNPTDTAFAGDWNGDASDTIGVRRAPVQPTAVAGWFGTDWEALPTSQRVVAITFDGGSSDAGVGSILSTLRRHGVTATFFPTGTFARSYPVAVWNMAAAGHAVGNHSDTHPYFTQLTDSQIRAELSAADASISALTGRSTRPLFRFPYGDRTAADVAVVNGAGYVPFRWTVDSLGWKGTSGGLTASLVCQRVLNTARPGQIVLMHVGANPDDGTILDADALPCIIEGLRARGYAFTGLRDFVG